MATKLTWIQVTLREFFSFILGLTAGGCAVLLFLGVTIGIHKGLNLSSLQPQQEKVTYRACVRNHRRTRCRVVAHASSRTHPIVIPAPAPDPNLWPAPGPPDPAAPQPQLTDPTGHYTFCGSNTRLVLVCVGTTVVGAYVDDTDPTRAADVALASQTYGFVIAALAPNDDPCSQFTEPGVLCAREWYPYDCRYLPGTWGPLPQGQSAYIVQWNFAWPGCGPPTVVERQTLLSEVQALHPQLILLY